MNNWNTPNDLQTEWTKLAGPPMSRQEVLAQLREFPEVHHNFLKLSDEFKEELISFSMGVQGVKITYDPFFKFVFDPYLKRDRLEDFLSQCLGEEVEILEVLPNESPRITEDSSLIIADLLVRLKSGALVNVEIQRIGYYFPGARCACYSSDLVMRQYSMLKERCRQQKKRFSYGDIQKVFTIVLMQKSTKEFHEIPEEYLHFAKQTFETGLKMDLLQEYLLVPLDIFLKIPHNNLSKLEAWLYFIASDRIEDIQKVCSAYPEFCELYRDVFKFRYHPKELVSMFSEALRILDQNTIQYMIDDLQKQLAEERAEKEERALALAEKETALTEKEMALAEKDSEIQRLKEELASLKSNRL